MSMSDLAIEMEEKMYEENVEQEHHREDKSDHKNDDSCDEYLNYIADINSGNSLFEDMW